MTQLPVVFDHGGVCRKRHPRRSSPLLEIVHHPMAAKAGVRVVTVKAVRATVRAVGDGSVGWTPAGRPEGGTETLRAEIGASGGESRVQVPAGVRLLVTGSRLWSDKRAIAGALSWAVGCFPDLLAPGEHGLELLRGRVTVVHGGARGADALAGRIAAAWGMRVEVHPADWDRWGRSAGHRRNAEMVALGADLCLAFPIGASRGTRGCMELARKAGIRTYNWPERGAALLANANAGPRHGAGGS